MGRLTELLDEWSFLLRNSPGFFNDVILLLSEGRKMKVKGGIRQKLLRGIPKQVKVLQEVLEGAP